MHKPSFYRPDIDGLRALAVILVLLFHADFSFFSGGYIGVDVFFVISGFLITKSINTEMLHGNFSFQSFYLRRIRRIIPVLVFVMLVVTIPAYILMFPNDLERFARTVIHTILSTNNFHLWDKGNNYFVENTELIPLLHTWSLAVEEQFYIIWPALLLLLHRFLRLKNRKYFISFFVIVALFLSVYLTHTDPGMAYYLLPARIFELGLGAALAILWKDLPKVSQMQNHLISIIGFGLILVPAIVLNKTSAFPGFNALWPCLGSTLLILSGKNQKEFGVINMIFAARPFVFIGLLSYSIYLWHWPIFVFIKYAGFSLTPLITSLAIALTILVSYLSWKLVEQPFRHTYKFSFSKTLLVVLLPCLVICSLIYGITDYQQGFSSRYPQLAEFNKDNNFPEKLRNKCFDTYKVGNCEECSLGVQKDTLDGVLIGDSFANHTAAFVDILAKDADLYFHDMAAGGYPLMNAIDNDNGKALRDVTYAENRLKFAKQFKTIIIAANWERFQDKESKGYQLTLDKIKELLSLQKNVIVVDPLRVTNGAQLHKMKVFKTYKKTKIKKKDLRIPFYKREPEYIINTIRKRFPEVTIINLNDVMCTSLDCDYQIENNIVYRDAVHLNTSGAELLGEKYIKEIGNPLLDLQN